MDRIKKLTSDQNLAFDELIPKLDVSYAQQET